MSSSIYFYENFLSFPCLSGLTSFSTSRNPNKTTWSGYFCLTFLVAWCLSEPVMIGLVNKPHMSSYIRSNLGQLKCVRPTGIIRAISAIIIEYINSVYTLLRYLESENHILLTRYFIHEILHLCIFELCR